MRMHLRPAAMEDREFLWRLHCKTMRDYVDKAWGWDQAFQRQWFNESFDPPSLQIIQSDDEPIGSISVRRPGHEIFLASIEISPERQNQGIASELIRELLEEANRSRVPVRLQVLKVNPARRLYERLGFQRSGETATHHLMCRHPLRAG